tara:strand:+ start:92 stop:766 length:675 start_codon:yes stop_codon:yes gene_type:complete
MKSPAESSDNLDELRQLHELKDKGILSDNEFNEQKTKILNRRPQEILTNQHVDPQISIWGSASWITQWKSKEENTIRGFPARFNHYNHPFRSWFGAFSSNVVAGLTGSSKLVIEPGRITEYTEALGYRTKRDLDLRTFDSIEFVRLPNQYLLSLSWILSLTFWGAFIGIPLAIYSFWEKQVFLVVHFGMKSTTNNPMIIRIESDDWRERISHFRKVLNKNREEK